MAFGKLFEILRNSNVTNATIAEFTFSNQFQKIMISSTNDILVSFNRDAGQPGGVWGANQTNVYHITSTSNRQGEFFDFGYGQILTVQVQAVSSAADVSIAGIAT